MKLEPFASAAEHRMYCMEACVMPEEGAVGFKIFEDEEHLGLCQLKFVGEEIYLLNLVAIESRLDEDELTSALDQLMHFFQQIGVRSVIYPVLTDHDPYVANSCGFDRVSETMFVYSFPSEEAKDGECACGHSH